MSAFFWCWWLGQETDSRSLRAVFIGNGINTVLIEWQLDGEFIRFALFVTIPILFAVSLVRFCHAHILTPRV